MLSSVLEKLLIFSHFFVNVIILVKKIQRYPLSFIPVTVINKPAKAIVVPQSIKFGYCVISEEYSTVSTSKSIKRGIRIISSLITALFIHLNILTLKYIFFKLY